MSAINFEGCNTIDDMYRRHSTQLRGKALLQCYGLNDLDSCLSRPASIHDFTASDRLASFLTEDGVGGLKILTFPRSLHVMTSIVEYGDVWWSSDDYDYSQFAIDDMPESFSTADNVLKTGELVPVTAR